MQLYWECSLLLSKQDADAAAGGGTACWPDGSVVTPIHRKLTIRCFTGKIPLHLRDGTGRDVAGAVDKATLGALMSFVPIPHDVQNGPIRTTDGVMLLNHRR
mmetsp:Transcript_21652/g.64604  ORF Transcript_21652/g.64604 Transcript_21652/m.64604 type:complete len:102 (-) Transcript_21652:165-470(-)